MCIYTFFYFHTFVFVHAAASVSGSTVATTVITTLSVLLGALLGGVAVIVISALCFVRRSRKKLARRSGECVCMGGGGREGVWGGGHECVWGTNMWVWRRNMWNGVITVWLVAQFQGYILWVIEQHKSKNPQICSPPQSYRIIIVACVLSQLSVNITTLDDPTISPRYVIWLYFSPCILGCDVCVQCVGVQCFMHPVRTVVTINCN